MILFFTQFNYHFILFFCQNHKLCSSAEEASDIGYDDVRFGEHPFIAVVDGEAVVNGFYSLG